MKGNKTHFRELIAEGYQPKDDKERGLLAGVENEKEFLHLADEVIVLSKDTQQILAGGYGVSSDKMHLVYNGLGDGLCFDKDKNVGNGRIILFVGRLDEIKGCLLYTSCVSTIPAIYARRQSCARHTACCSSSTK